MINPKLNKAARVATVAGLKPSRKQSDEKPAPGQLAKDIRRKSMDPNEARQITDKQLVRMISALVNEIDAMHDECIEDGRPAKECDYVAQDLRERHAALRYEQNLRSRLAGLLGARRKRWMV